MATRQHERHGEHVRGLVLIIAGILLLAGIVLLVTLLDRDETPEPAGAGRAALSAQGSSAGRAPLEDSRRTDVGTQRRVVWNGVEYRLRSGVETILLIGYDKDSETFRSYRDGGQADFLVVAVIDNPARTVRLLQINRDTMARMRVYGITGRPTGTKEYQIALAHCWLKDADRNDENTKWAVENLLNIRIDHTASMGFAGIGPINRLAGGVRVTVPVDMTMVDPSFVEGADVTLETDAQAMGFVRARMRVGDGRNTSRMVRQSEFINGFIRQTKDIVRGNPDYVNTIVNTFYEVANISADQEWMFERMASIYLNSYRINTHPDVLPGENVFNEQTQLWECRLDDEAVVRWVLDYLYEPVNAR